MKTRLLQKKLMKYNLKPIFLYLPIYFWIQLLSGQTIVLENLENPGGLQIINNHLYFTEKLDSNQGKISKIDLSQSNPTIQIVYQGFNQPVHTAINNSDLYVLELYGRLYKLDITQNNPTPTFIADVAIMGANSRCSDLTIANNEAYISLIDEKKIVKVNLNDNLPTTAQDFITGLTFPGDLVLVGQDLYYSDFFSGNGGSRLYKTDISTINPIIIENALGTGLSFIHNNNVLYCIEKQNSFKRISEIDLSDSFPTHSSNHINGLSSADEYLLLDGNTFYVASHVKPGGSIKSYVSNSLNTNDYMLKNKLRIYPNPATSFIKIKSKSLDQEIQSVEVFNLLGKKFLHQKNKTFNTVLNTSSLSKGIYFIKLKTNSQQFTKKIIIE